MLLLLSKLILIPTAVISVSVSSPQTNYLFHVPAFKNVGVTSISPAAITTSTSANNNNYSDTNTDAFTNTNIPNTVGNNSGLDRDRIWNDQKIFFVGTKRGKLKKIAVPVSASASEAHDDDGSCEIETIDIQDSSNDPGRWKLKPFPIFSITHIDMHVNMHISKQTKSDNDLDHDDNQEKYQRLEMVLCGGGDRFITAWQREHQHQHQRADESSWLIQSQLGPHTGWVKDQAVLTFSSSLERPSLSSSPSSETLSTTLLFSIGCNCIEVWKMVENLSEWQWHPYQKLQIESCPTMGSTLSSDLLCLATSTSISIQKQMQTKSQTDDHMGTSTAHLFAGGVDGRLHRWTIASSILDNDEFTPASESASELFSCSLENTGVVSAHNGRISDLVMCENLKVLVSCGHDSCIHCRDATVNAGEEGQQEEDLFQAWSVTSLNLEQEMNRIMGTRKRIEDENEILLQKCGPDAALLKITSLCIVHENHKEATLAVGTACGMAAIIKLVRSNDSSGTLHMNVLNANGSNGIIQLNEKSVIHAVESVPIRVPVPIESMDIGQELAATEGMKGAYKIIIGHSKGISLWKICV